MSSDSREISRHCEEGERLFLGEDGVYAATDSESRPDYFSSDTFSFQLSNGSRYRITPPDALSPLVSKLRSLTSSPHVSLVASSPATLSIAIVILAVFITQIVALLAIGMDGLAQWEQLYVLNTDHLEFVWTWFTSIFSHGGVFHVFVNTLVLLMFAPLVEYHLGSKKYVLFFIVAGLASSVAQVSVALAVNSQISLLGASGAIAGTLGYLGMREPDLKVYFLAILPMSLFVLNTLFVGASFILIGVYGVGAFGVAHTAHAGGILFGAIVGGWESNRAAIEFVTDSTMVKFLTRFWVVVIGVPRFIYNCIK